MKNKIIHGNCIEELKKLKSESIDAIITDPPYAYSKQGFMQKSWDGFNAKEFKNFSKEWGKEGLRVLKKGGYLLAFGSPKMYHVMTYALQKIGFDIKDCLMWLNGQGFPKNYDISKGIDKYYGLERKGIIKEEIGKKDNKYNFGFNEGNYIDGKPECKESKLWNGYGTALKPAFEPIVLCQKPYEVSYVNNVLKYGTGGLNIDKCRIPIDSNDKNLRKNAENHNYKGDDNSSNFKLKKKAYYNKDNDLGFHKSNGRFPSNVLLDKNSAKLLDNQTGNLENGYRPNQLGKINDIKTNQVYGKGYKRTFTNENTHNDIDGASRFFYTSKVHKSERNAGCKDLYWEKKDENTIIQINKEKYDKLSNDKRIKGNYIVSVKPINLMRYLVRLVSPPKELKPVILDIFAGSGTTLIGCVIEGIDYIGIEKRSNFAIIIIPNRIKYWENSENWKNLKDHNLLPKPMSKKIKQKGLI